MHCKDNVICNLNCYFWYLSKLEIKGKKVKKDRSVNLFYTSKKLFKKKWNCNCQQGQNDSSENFIF